MAVRHDQGKVSFLGAGFSAMHEVHQLVASPDVLSLAVESRGEGHPVVETVSLKALLRGRYEVTASVDPYPGSVEIVRWGSDGLVIRSDAPLHRAGVDGRVPPDATEQFAERLFVLDNGRVRLSMSPTPRQ